MTATLDQAGRAAWPVFELPEDLVATAPLEAKGRRRDEARMLVTSRSDDRLLDATAADLPRFLEAGDVLVVNTSATLPAAVPTAEGLLLHLSTELADGSWLVELRQPCGTGSQPFLRGRPGAVVRLPGGGVADLLRPFAAPLARPAGQAPRLWVARLHLPDPLVGYLHRHGRPIRYGCTDEAWPLAAYQTVFATEAGSAEMASAGRPFTPQLVTALVTAGIVIVPVVLHTGVSSPEADEPPAPERYRVPATSAALVNVARVGGLRVIAVGTTCTRALETAADGSGLVHAGAGWTELVITPQRGVRAVDGILTGWHEPRSSHLQLLEAVAGRHLLERSYTAALDRGYLWHELGDLHLVLP